MTTKHTVAAFAAVALVALSLGAKTHVMLPVVREDFLDGRLDLSVNLMTGSALAVDRIRIIPKKE